jgi:hypothetical protein
VSTIGDVTTIPAGWYPDPENSARSRWWNGTAWTASVSEPQPAPPQEPFIQQPVATPQRSVEQLPFVPTEPEARAERETAQPFNPQQSELQRLLNQATPPAAPVAGALTRRQLRELTSGGGVAEPTPVVPTAQIPAPSAAPGTPFGDVAVMPATNSYTAPVASFDDLLAGTEPVAPDETVPAPEPVQVAAPPAAEVAVVPHPVVEPAVAEPAPQAVQPEPYVEPPTPNVNPYSQPAPPATPAYPGAAVATVASSTPAAAVPAPANPVLTPEPIVPGVPPINPYSTAAPAVQHTGPISAAALFAPVPTSANAFGAAPAAAFAAAPAPAAAPAFVPAPAAPAAGYGGFPAAKSPSGYAPFSPEMARPIPVIASLLPTSTLAVWLFALWPLILSVGLAAAFLSFDVLLDIPTAVFGALYVVLNLLFASNDKKKLESIGHERGVSPWWSLLPLVFLIIRTARLGARSVAPLIVWLLANVASAAVGFYGFQLIAAQSGIVLPF